MKSIFGVLKKFYNHPAMRYGYVVALAVMVFAHNYVWVCAASAVIIVPLPLFNAMERVFGEINRMRHIEIHQMTLTNINHLVNDVKQELNNSESDIDQVRVALGLVSLLAEATLRNPDEAVVLMDVLLEMRDAPASA